MRRDAQKRLIVAAGILVSFGILSGLIFKNAHALLKVSKDIDWRWVWVSMGCSIGSYVMVGLALEEVLAILGYVLSFPEMLGIALVSATANYFVSTAGVSGFALKAHLLRKRHVPYGITLTCSVLSSAILYLVLAVIIGQGLVYLMLNLHSKTMAIMESVFGLGMLLAVTVPMMVFFFNHELRGKMTRKLFSMANHGAYYFSKSEIPKEDFMEFEEQLTEGLERVRHGSHGLARVVAYTALDWLLCMATLLFAFKAVGVNLSIGFLSAGFTAGQAATLIPILPGGLGVVEGSMAAIFQGLGIDFEKALVAVLLYRAAYYAVPGFVSVIVLWGLKMSEPALIEETVLDILPEELRREAQYMEKHPGERKTDPDPF